MAGTWLHGCSVEMDVLWVGPARAEFAACLVHLVPLCRPHYNQEDEDLPSIQKLRVAFKV